MIDWQNVQKVLIVRLRSIGDTVLTTPSLISLREFLPHAQIDIVLEDWVAPVLDGFEYVDNVLMVSRDTKDRVKLAHQLRKEKYDVALNMHGGTTATFFVRASGAKHRIGYSNYRYSFLYNHRLTSASGFWGKEKTHSAEQQMALLGFVGVPVKETQKTKLAVTEDSLISLETKLSAVALGRRTSKFALVHPAAAFESKQWAPEKFARVAEFVDSKGIRTIAIATKQERAVLDSLENSAKIPIITLDDLSLQEITALASKAKVFVGNDSGIAHIATAVQTPSVVIFGSSNRDHWHPWTDAPNEMVYEKMPCQPCAGHVCKKFDEPKCILGVKTEQVLEAIGRVIG